MLIFYKIEKLNNRNYKNWAIIMRIIFDEKNVLEVVTEIAANKLKITMLVLKKNQY